MNDRNLPLRYPKTDRVDQVDDYHGRLVPDPFRWLEDPDSPQTRAWIEAQNRLTFGFLETIPAREPLRRRLTELWDYERFGIPWRRGESYFYTRNNGLQNQDSLFTTDSLEGTPRLLLDPNLLSEDGTIAAVEYAASENGRYLAYEISASGSDWIEIRVRDVRTGRDLEDRIRWVKFSQIAWDRKGEGFFYSRYDEPKPGQPMEAANFYHKLYYHHLGTSQDRDRLVYERPDQKEWGFLGKVTEDGRYLVIHVWRGSNRENLLFYQDLGTPGGKIVELIHAFDAEYDFIGSDGPLFWVRTDNSAPRGRIIEIDLRRPESQHWRELVPMREETLSSAATAGERIFAHYLKDAHSLVREHRYDGTPVGEIRLPGLGTTIGFQGRREDRETFYLFTSFTTPGTIYRYDIAQRASSIFRRGRLRFDPDDYVTEQVFFESKDHTRVPMFLTHKKGVLGSGPLPTFLYGYGGFNISQTPGFSPSTIAWMEMGGIHAMANIRGGGEYGESWHRQGMKEKKQNVFDDFIAASEWLIAKGYTSTRKIAISGGSNGGLLVGACLVQRPDLFGAALASVGVFDMLRFHKFTIGWAWTSDYGSPDDPDDFATLYGYSPLHNIEEAATYPPTLITTADHDDRVVPAHSFKFASALQAAQGGDAPILIRIETKAGHGMGKPTTKMIEELSDRLAFLTWALEIPFDGLP